MPKNVVSQKWPYYDEFASRLRNNMRQRLYFKYALCFIRYIFLRFTCYPIRKTKSRLSPSGNWIFGLSLKLINWKGGWSLLLFIKKTPIPSCSKKRGSHPKASSLNGLGWFKIKNSTPISISMNFEWTTDSMLLRRFFDILKYSIKNRKCSENVISGN